MKRGLLIVASALAIANANAADIKGYLHHEGGPAPGYKVELSNALKTFETTSDSSGFYAFPADSFAVGDTIKVRGHDSLETMMGWTIYTVKGSQNYVPELYVSGAGEPNFTPNVRWVNDTSNVNNPLWGYFWKKGSTEICSVLVDTSRIAPHYDWFANSKELLQHGDSAFILFQKINLNTILQTLIGFEIDTVYGNAMQVLRNGNSGAQSIYFPTKIIADTVGIEENRQARSSNTWINPATGKIRIHAKSMEIYSIDGRHLRRLAVQNDIADLGQLPQGIYFIRTESGTGKLIKLSR